MTGPGDVGLLRGAWLVFRTDARLELRTLDATITSLLFAGLVLAVAAFGLAGSADRPAALAPAAFWIAVSLAANLAVVRSWTRERDDGALDSLLLAPIPRASILAGKAAAVAAVLAVVEAALAIPAVVLFGVDVPATAVWIIPAAGLATVGIALVGALFGAMVAGGASRDLLVGIAIYPLLVPLFLGAVELSGRALAGAGFSELSDWLALMAAFDLAVGGAAFWLFDQVVRE
ncbi:MAG: heme exporter protein CcmB [Myxococcota bacterium]|nr:heme exporter protein CcmB [Myxococcota bacterium]